ncbi:MAG: SLC13 family permease [Eubacteriales bacterium]
MTQTQKQNPLIRFFLKNPIVCIAFLAAIVTCFFVPPDQEYFGYFDWKTLSCLFCTLAVVTAFKQIRFFEFVAHKIVVCFRNVRNVTFALVAITYFGSMLLANDMALITFLPLGYFVLTACNQRKHLAYVFVLQNVAANLGGMLTPFGNPQNLYLFSYFDIPTEEFFSIMLVPSLVAFVSIFALCFFIKREQLTVPEERIRLNVPKTVAYGILFLISVLIVFKAFPYWIGLVIVSVGIFILDRQAFRHVDYGLLFTFCAFFLFSGNLARIEAVRSLLSKLVELSPLLVGSLLCQFISNVPTAVLLSHFTMNYPALLIAVNIGGLGTPIASLASLITFRQFRATDAQHTGKYLAIFSIVNFSLLALLIVTSLLCLA